MNELFKKIPCSERLPEKEGVYDTMRGRLLFQKGSFYDNTYSSELNGNHFAPVTPEYWYEPIQLPTDEEIEKIAKKEMDLKHIMALDERSISDCIDGFKSAIELLTGGK